MPRRNQADIMPNKDAGKHAVLSHPDKAVSTAADTIAPALKSSNLSSKIAAKIAAEPLVTMIPDPKPIPPQPPPPPAEDAELLGSLTTQQQQRTSARVIKKMRLDTEAGASGHALLCCADNDQDKQDADKDASKEPGKEAVKHNAGKQRMPKALWSQDEKRLFFEALNEYGKDFDAITSYIGNKMKKKAVPEAVSKTKFQVSHFYYRTWHKISKYLKCFDNEKKVAQELYALINYGEMRKKLISLSEKSSPRLSELIVKGNVAVKAKGKTLRIRTPMCRALRRLNQLEDDSEQARLPTRATVCMNAKDISVWTRVQSISHNPRVRAPCALSTKLASLIEALEIKWTGSSGNIDLTTDVSILPKLEDFNPPSAQSQKANKEGEEEENKIKQIASEMDSAEVDDRFKILDVVCNDRLALHIGPKPGVEIHLPMVSLTEPLTSQKICFTSYQDRMCKIADKKRNTGTKIKSHKRTRKDSGAENDPKRIKSEEIKSEYCDNSFKKLADIDETAVDGMELKVYIDDARNADDDVPVNPLEGVILENHAEDKSNGSIDIKEEGPMPRNCISDAEEDGKQNHDVENDGFPSKFGKDHVISSKKTGNLKLKIKFQHKPTDSKEKPSNDVGAIEMNGALPMTVNTNENEDATLKTVAAATDKGVVLKNWDVDTITKQVRRGWSVYDCGNLTIGDLYLMFGSDTKLELDYWWAEPTPPLSDSLVEQTRKLPDHTAAAHPGEATEMIEASDAVEDREKARESDCDLFSPNSNDGISGDEKKESLSPEQKHRLLSKSSRFLIASKLVNNPDPPQPIVSSANACAAKDTEHIVTLTTRLRKLLSLSLLHSRKERLACPCGHVCGSSRPRKGSVNHLQEVQNAEKHPRNRVSFTPVSSTFITRESGEKHTLDDLPKWTKRGKVARSREPARKIHPIVPKPADVVFPVLHPLMAAPMEPSIVISYPTNQMPSQRYNNTRPTKEINILPLPPKEAKDKKSLLGNGHQASDPKPPDNRKAPPNLQSFKSALVEIVPEAKSVEPDNCREDKKESFLKQNDPPSLSNFLDMTLPSNIGEESVGATDHKESKSSQEMFSGLLHTESMSMSPSRLLNDQWLDPDVHDFSLSSFLRNLDSTPISHSPVKTEEVRTVSTPSVPVPKSGAAVMTTSNMARNCSDSVMDSQLQCLMSETSIDYMAKFADLAAVVAAENNKT